MTFLGTECFWLLLKRLARVTVLMACMSAGSSVAQNNDFICRYVIKAGQDGVTDNVPVTFGAVFVKGDVPANSSIRVSDDAGNPLPFQVDAKARHPDGSLRHAVVTVVVPRLPTRTEFGIRLYRGAPAASAPISLSDIPQNLDLAVTLALSNGPILTATAKDLVAGGKPESWLAGPQVSEWWFAGPLRDPQGTPDPHLMVRLGLRSYGKDRPLRVEIDVENTWTWVPHPQTEFYDARIVANGQTILNQVGMAQQAHTRWRKVFWWAEPVNAFVAQPLDYLKRARVIPNYDPDARVSETDLANFYGLFESRDRRPLETGVIMHYMPTTGGRGDIGPLPQWAVYYLLTMDRRAYEMMLVSGDLAGSYMSHYRNEKTGRPTTSEDYPSISIHENYVGKPGNLEVPDDGGHRWNIVADPAHEPSLAFIPYLVTGDRYYLEELQFWSQFNAWATAPETHGFEKGLVTWGQVRGQGWSLRTLGQAAFITPDDDPLKGTLNRELSANLAFYDQIYTNNPGANIFHAALYRPAPPPREYSPWMDDFLTWSVGYVAGLGFDQARPFANWKGYYAVQRMINPDYCWMVASSYRMIYQRADLTTVSSWQEALQLTLAFSETSQANPASQTCGGDEMAYALKLRPGQMLTSGIPGGYAAILQSALAEAVDYRVPGADEAWTKYRALHNTVEPEWAILPWSSK